MVDERPRGKRNQVKFRSDSHKTCTLTMKAINAEMQLGLTEKLYICEGIYCTLMNGRKKIIYYYSSGVLQQKLTSQNI